MKIEPQKNTKGHRNKTVCVILCGSVAICVGVVHVVVTTPGNDEKLGAPASSGLDGTLEACAPRHFRRRLGFRQHLMDCLDQING
jgi:hypothetical protein